MVRRANAGSDRVFDALGDGTRREIVKLLAEQPRSVQAIADRLPVSRPAVSKHLRLLGEAGLVRAESIGTRRIYQLDGAGVRAARDYFDRMWDVALARFQTLAENTAPAKPATDEESSA